MTDAACKGTAPKRERGSTRQPDGTMKPAPRVKDQFFPERGDTVSDAQMVCFTCTVRPQCSAYSERVGADYGVWAGAIKKRGKNDSEDS